MDLTKLPKWAREYIENIQRQRDEAVRRYEELIDQQTPCPFYSDDYTTYGDKPTYQKLYFNVHRMTLKTDKVEVSFNPDRDGEVYISFCGGHSYKPAYIQPVAGNAIRIVPGEN